MYHPPPAPVYDQKPTCRIDASLIPSAQRSFIYTTTSSGNLQCGNMLQCFNSSHNTAIANGAPFERRSEISCEQCLKICEGKRASGRRYECLSVVYDYVRNVCDLYSVTGGTWPQCLASMNGYVYFRPTGHCVPAPQPQLSSCQPPRKRKMLTVEEAMSTSPAFVPLGSHNMAECLKACEENRDKDGNALALGDVCRAAMYAQNQCQISPSPLDLRTLKKMPGSAVGVVKCLRDVPSCLYPFRVMQQRILVGHARAVTDASSLEDCVQQCLSVQEFRCKSGMFFLEAGFQIRLQIFAYEPLQDRGQNCILNTETAGSKRDLFTPEEQHTVFYFDLTCNPDISCTRARSFREASAPAERAFQNTELSGWTDWSPCSKTTFKRYRYKQCGLKDIRRCERETKECVPDM
ncbi:PAN 1 domain containing protein [Trichuris trichiura]|uniref:PAN 1 domain containing protein n=1 Tax=Trichuris trichiura TaxID=36087 RepID=A0A077Z4C4_TRITR|nr:PAN 1 domain containing protein [Trichuris trichiura]